MRVLRIAGMATGCVGVALGLVLLTYVVGHAHDRKAWEMAAAGDTSRDEWFKSLKHPNGTGGCCSLTDCKQTEAEWRPDGKGGFEWWALVEGYQGEPGAKTWTKGKKWQRIPPGNVLKTPLSIDGEAYVCHSDGTPGGLGYIGGGIGGSYYSNPSSPVIYCFVPPIPGY